MLSMHEAASGAGAAPAAPAVSAEELGQGVASFEAVTGVGGVPAQYYVYTALSHGEPVDMAIQHYFDNDCAPPPGSSRAAERGRRVVTGLGSAGTARREV